MVTSLVNPLILSLRQQQQQQEKQLTGSFLLVQYTNKVEKVESVEGLKQTSSIGERLPRVHLPSDVPTG